MDEVDPLDFAAAPSCEGCLHAMEERVGAWYCPSCGATVRPGIAENGMDDAESSL